MLCNQEIAFIGATEDEDVVRVGQVISQSSYSRQQSFSFCEIERKHSEMISNSFELRSVISICCKKQFLKNDRIHSKTNAAFRFSREQLHCGQFATKVSDDDVSIKKHERSLTFRTVVLFERLWAPHLLHFFIVGES